MVRLPAPFFAVLSAALALGCARAARAPDAPNNSVLPRVSGFGGFPLTAQLTSMWAALDERAAPGKKPLTFIVYFRGKPGWHERGWQSNFRPDQEPALVEFASDSILLRADYHRATRVVHLFRSDVDVSKANVVLVDHVDDPPGEVVVPLGRVSLEIPEDENPAVYVLQHSPDIRRALLPSQ
jgi:hypothetical protein